MSRSALSMRQESRPGWRHRSCGSKERRRPRSRGSGNIVGHNGAPGERCLQRRHAQGFIARGRGIDRRRGCKAREVETSVCGPRIATDVLLGRRLSHRREWECAEPATVCSAPTMQTGKRMNVLRQQTDLLPRVDQAADRKHGIVFVDIGIKKNRISSGIDDRLAPRPRIVSRDQRVEHPVRRRNHGIRARNAAHQQFPDTTSASA